MKYILMSLIVLCTVMASCMTEKPKPAAIPNPYGLPDGLYSEITTPKGVFVCELFYKKTPMTVASHVGLAEGTLGNRKGQPFYDGTTWHRVVANFLIQGGDGATRVVAQTAPATDTAPATGRGRGRGAGNIGYSFPDEIVPGLRHDGPGTMQMANGGPDTNGSQFCIMTTDQTGLNYNHTVFGHVVRGMDVVDRVEQGDTMQVKILRLGADAKAFKADEATFQALVAKAKRFDGPRQPGPDAFLDDPDNLVTGGRGSTFMQFKLANFERFTGERIMARIYAKTPEDAQGEKLNPYLAALADKLKVADHGALVVYFQDQDKWIVRIGKNSQASFMAGPRKADGTKDPAAARPTMDAAMADFMTVVTAGGRGRGAGAAGRGAATQPVAQTSTAPASTATSTAPTTGRGRGRGGAGGRGGAAGASGVAGRLIVLLDNLIFRLEPAAP